MKVEENTSTYIEETRHWHHILIISLQLATDTPTATVQSISSSTPSMAKIQAIPAASSTPSSCSPSGDGCQSLQKQAVYTVWLKSLVFNGNGCTVYGADGRVAFRVDNYGCKGGREVFFMDHAGKTLIRIQRKSFGVFKRWEACRCLDDGEGFGEETRPWFRAQKAQGNGAAVTMHGSGRTYRIDGCARKSDYKISGADGALVAAIGRKQTASGVVLGEDVLTLAVVPEVNHLLVLGALEETKAKEVTRCHTSFQKKNKVQYKEIGELTCSPPYDPKEASTDNSATENDQKQPVGL
ncbi:protein LURP-one-related 11-like isoform X2 [Phragmites australis]|uniref:protein LURP-one-related 11-like isoform X2 n=1 Tax=Phragmites australis TaxID=29695 RepID=UPI002D79B02C|nr:protein LURP-one-related 11-like isoform X2 [Phragmites australis]